MNSTSIPLPKLTDRCKMSFADLYREARGGEWTDQERAEFDNLDQEGRNGWVRQLASEVGTVQTELKIGTDGVAYLAFWMEEKTTTAAE